MITMLPINESKAAPTPRKSLNPLLRLVSKTIRKKASKGGAGSNQTSVDASINNLPLPFQ